MPGPLPLVSGGKCKVATGEERPRLDLPFQGFHQELCSRLRRTSGARPAGGRFCTVGRSMGFVFYSFVISAGVVQFRTHSKVDPKQVSSLEIGSS